MPSGPEFFGWCLCDIVIDDHAPANRVSTDSCYDSYLCFLLIANMMHLDSTMIVFLIALQSILCVHEDIIEAICRIVLQQICTGQLKATHLQKYFNTLYVLILLNLMHEF